MSDPTDYTAQPFVKVFTDDGGYVCIVPTDEGKLDGAVTRWLDSGETRDTLLDLTLLCGDTYRLRASQVTLWIVSTPDGRERQRAIDAAFKAESAWDEEE